jgi:hypothetical protein
MMSGLLVDETRSGSHNVAMTMTRLANQRPRQLRHLSQDHWENNNATNTGLTA